MCIDDRLCGVPILCLRSVVCPTSNENVIKKKTKNHQVVASISVYVITNWDLWPARFSRHSNGDFHSPHSIEHLYSSGNYETIRDCCLPACSVAFCRFWMDQTICDLLFDLYFLVIDPPKCSTIYTKHIKWLYRIFPHNIPKIQPITSWMLAFNIQNNPIQWCDTLL